MASPFKHVEARKPKDIDIETLFQELKRSPKIPFLFSHQADILREYESKYVNTNDISLELPTGSGKTLVALLIGEWMRRIHGKRVVYLCPTRQLANQVGRQSRDYGINTHVFIGSKKKYNSKALSSYRAADIIAVLTYSGLFNVNPGINDPQTIILDDAHGAESYIGSMWSLEIRRFENTELYSKIIELFEKELPPHFIRVINSEKREYITQKTEKVPFGVFHQKLIVLRETLNSYFNENDSSLWFPWSMIRNALNACHIFISYDTILIRPYIPPTLTHKPFANAEQRLYMSATLGRGGELERITGVRKIERIPTPKRYEKSGIGRRFFIFPDYALEPSSYNRWILERLSGVDRTLILCPNQHKVTQFTRIISQSLPSLKVLDKYDIDETLEAFTGTKNCVLILANRYDGIDLPNGVCRQEIIDGLPSGTNLQETFLEERLGLDVLLKERIKTRIQQAAGRCIRSDVDSAAILMLDRRLLEFCVRRENQDIFHPEIRAEMRIFFDSKPSDINSLDAMYESFMSQDENWQSAEENIIQLRSDEELPDSSVTEVLANVVKDEVDFSYALWAGDYEKAIECGRRVTDGLSGLKLAPYRALWYYFTANPAIILSKNNKVFESLGYEFLNRAKEACRTVSWFPHALRSMLPESAQIEETTEIQALAVEGVLNILDKLGSVGPRFQSKMDEIEKLLNEKDPHQFDRGLNELGALLGYTTFIPTGTAPPDSAWHLESLICMVFEGKSQESPNDGISVSNCTQTSNHLKWVASNERLKEVKKAYSILVSPKTTIDNDAIPFGDDIYYLHIDDIMSLFRRAKLMLIESRSLMTEKIDDNFRVRVINNLIRYKLAPEDIIKLITTKLVKSLPHTNQ